MPVKLDISRRDFVNGSLVGVGAALVGPAQAATGESGSEAPEDTWTGYGGVGDYADSNGNVASVREAAHLIRDGISTSMLDHVADTGEEYDLVIVGGGFSGIGAKGCMAYAAYAAQQLLGRPFLSDTEYKMMDEHFGQMALLSALT